MTTLLITAHGASAYSRGIHDVGTARAIEAAKSYDRIGVFTNTDAYAAGRGNAGYLSFFPLLSNDASWFGNGVLEAARNYDDFVGDMGTRNHFWESDDSLNECPEGWAGVDNAWETARVQWENALADWRAGLTAHSAWHLGCVIHLVEDMGQPAHDNSDMHGPGNRDSLEEWGGYATITPMYSWTDAGITKPGQLFRPPSMQTIIDRVVARTEWGGRSEFMEDPVLMDPNNINHTSQLFWIMYVTNQWGNYFASDGEYGNRHRPLGWVSYNDLGFPQYLHLENGGHVPCQDMEALADNEGDCGHAGATDEYCDKDGDLTTIARWGYKAAMRGAAGVLELFRRTIDSVPPVTTVQLTKSGGATYTADTWSSLPVTVNLASATDPNSDPSERATGLWSMFAKTFETPWSPMPPCPITRMEKTYSTTGSSYVYIRTADNAGNMEWREIKVKVDVDSPVVTFPGWRPDARGYLECETLRPTYEVKDKGSGLSFATGRLDGELVSKTALVNLWELAIGDHGFQVMAVDKAANFSFTGRKVSVLTHGPITVGRPSFTRYSAPRYLITGTLTPLHYRGGGPITVKIWKKDGGSWIAHSSHGAVIQADGSYKGFATLFHGQYKARAYHVHPTVPGPYSYFEIN